MKSPFYTFWNTKSILYSVIRNDNKINDCKGLPNNDSGRLFIGFPADYDIAVGDILIPQTKKNFNRLSPYWKWLLITKYRHKKDCFQNFLLSWNVILG